MNKIYYAEMVLLILTIMPTTTHDVVSSTAESLSTIIMVMSYIAPLVGLVLLGLLLWKKKYIWSVVIFLLLSLFCYSRFIEKEMIVVKQEFTTFSGTGTQLTELNIALFADAHIGVYTSSAFLQRVVDTVNAQSPDLVLIPGDFIYGMSLKELETAFAPLQKLNVPVYAVAGNHDSEQPGSIPSDTVREKVGAYGVRFIDNGKGTLTIKDKEITVFGLSDLWEGKMEVASLESVVEADNSILIVHNPDTLHHIKQYPVDLVVAGHTHGGQMRIPFLYKHMIPTEYDYERGWYDTQGYKLYVTSGVGEVGLPMRLGVPPEVVMIRARLR